ncbi:MAG: AEC family transporter, partial [Anaerotignaceae bacterium]
MAFSQLLSSMAMLLAMICPGIIFRKKNLVSPENAKTLSGIMVNLIIPCIVINAFQIEYTQTVAQDILWIFILWTVVTAFCGFIYFILIKMGIFSITQKGVLVCALMISNTGFIGIPLFHAFYGAQGLFYASV